MQTMERSGLEISGSSHNEHEATEDTEENSSQTQQRQDWFMSRQSIPSLPFRARSTDVSTAQEVRQTTAKSDGGDLPHPNSAVNRISSGTPEEGDGGSQSGGAAQHGSVWDQVQDHDPGSPNESSAIDVDDSERSSVSDCDFDHIMPAEKNDVGNCSQWCSICRDVEQWMIQGEGDWKFWIGTWEDLQARAGCPSCDDMLSVFSGSKRIRMDSKVYFDRNDIPDEGLLYSYEFRSDIGGLTGVLLNPLDRPSHFTLVGSMVDPNWFDIARLQKWVAFCNENHDGQCHSLPIQHESVSTRPRFLIDVKQGCLVESHGDERYFALSYVWGKQDAGTTTKANLDSLKLEGAITVRNVTFKLPRTVEDAIKLTKLLGERFLWIDRLCIIQDDLANWHSQIKKMGSIYANAYCTFIAAEGSDANHGIPGLSQHSGPRQLLQKRVRFPSLQMIETQEDHDIYNSTWNKRGWTFQELLLSRRVILFHNDVRWVCHQSKWQEDISAEPEGIAPKFQRWRGNDWDPLSVEPWPDFVEWWRLMSSYSPRQFQFENDAGAAFAGIEEILGHSFPGGFCFGMPEFYFDIALLWWPWSPQQRRPSKSDGTSDLPSWSFLGWKGGQITWDCPGFACEWLTAPYPNFQPFCSTSSIVPKVNWIQKGPCGQERPIRNDYHIWKRRQDQQSPEAQAKLGWRRDSTSFWTQASIPDISFRYPVPFGFQKVEDEYRTWSASLRLRSQSAFFAISNVIPRTPDPSIECSCAELVAQTGEWAGMLHLNTDKDVLSGEICELVALSYGSVSNDDEEALTWLEEWEVDGRPKSSEKYEFYNVMWIKREEGYVVRENVGRVDKSVWDSQDLQEIDVELR